MKRYVVGKNEEKKIEIRESGEYVVELNGEGARAEIVGGWHLRGKEAVKVKLLVVHKSPHTSANTKLKAVLDDESSIDLFGKIVVEKGAQQTESFLREAVLMISPKARALAVPDLEISANEVKCSHAAAVSRVDEEQVYYLMSRGLNRKSAVEMMVEGFLTEVGV